MSKLTRLVYFGVIQKVIQIPFQQVQDLTNRCDLGKLWSKYWQYITLMGLHFLRLHFLESFVRLRFGSLGYGTFIYMPLVTQIFMM